MQFRIQGKTRCKSWGLRNKPLLFPSVTSEIASHGDQFAMTARPENLKHQTSNIKPRTFFPITNHESLVYSQSSILNRQFA
jgi:hypothetical protein